MDLGGHHIRRAHDFPADAAPTASVDHRRTHYPLIPNIDPIQYHQDAKVIPLKLQKSNFAFLGDYIPGKTSVMDVYASQYYINPSTFAPAGEEDSGATWHRH
jgi:hypothetical protein